MKKITDVVLRAVANTAMNSTKKEAYSTCIFIGYQSKNPEKLY